MLDINSNKPSSRCVTWWLLPTTADSDEWGSGQFVRPWARSSPHSAVVRLQPLFTMINQWR